MLDGRDGLSRKSETLEGGIAKLERRGLGRFFEGWAGY